MHILHYVAIIYTCRIFQVHAIHLYCLSTNTEKNRSQMSLISIINNLIMMTFQILQRHFKNFFGRNINMYVNNVSNFNVNVCQKILILYKIIPSQVWFRVSHFFPGTQLITFLFPTLMSPGEQPYVIDGGMYVLFTMIRFSVGGSGSLQTAEHTKK